MKGKHGIVEGKKWKERRVEKKLKGPTAGKMEQKKKTNGRKEREGKIRRNNGRKQ